MPDLPLNLSHQLDRVGLVNALKLSHRLCRLLPWENLKKIGVINLVEAKIQEDKNPNMRCVNALMATALKIMTQLVRIHITFASIVIKLSDLFVYFLYTQRVMSKGG